MDFLKDQSNSNKNQNIKSNNIKRIFQTITLLSPISRCELQKVTALSWGAISMYVGELIEMGLIREAGSQTTSVGRKPKDIDINPADYLLIGVDLNLSGVSAIVTDFKGRIVYSCKRMFAFKDKTDVIDSLIEIMDETLKQFGKKKLLA
jgi:hypothetical protein